MSSFAFMGNALRDAFAQWNCLSDVSNSWWTRRLGPAAIAAVARSRLTSLVQFARSHSPFIRKMYSRLPEADFLLEELPVVTKAQMMEHFDDWVTDRNVTQADVQVFLENPDLIGRRYLGRYAVWKSSGSTGTPGIYVQDGDALAVYDSLIALQLESPSLFANYASGLLTKSGRAALVAATGAHFASIAS